LIKLAKSKSFSTHRGSFLPSTIHPRPSTFSPARGWAEDKPGSVLVMMLSFRIGLLEVHASFASALRQVSTVFGLAIGFFVFRESRGAGRVISTLTILAGAVLIKMG
jgi:hypothetical protein